MKRKIDLIVKIEITLHKENLLLELLGKHGDRLPKDIQEDMRQYAKDFEDLRNNFKKRLRNELKI